MGSRYPGGQGKFPLMLIILLLGVGILGTSCQLQPGSLPDGERLLAEMEGSPGTGEPELPLPTPFPTRPGYAPGELVEYIAQPGDTLPMLAIHFNTSEDEILYANPNIPQDATTMPPGMPMLIPIYYKPFWGSPYQIIPDSLFVNGPSQVGFDTQAFVDSMSGWFSSYTQYAAGANRSGAEIVDYVAENFSISPQLLLALLDYQTGALSRRELPVTRLGHYPGENYQ